ncbi:ARM repeat-containing protein, partial [Rozella allomycis CSF55]
MIIGNRTKKEMFISMGIIPQLMNCAKETNLDVATLIEIVIVLGSLAYGSYKTLQELVENGVCEYLLELLEKSFDNSKLCEVTTRALEAVLRYHSAPRDLIFSVGNDTRIKLLVKLLEYSGNQGVAENSALILANCCDLVGHQTMIAAAGAVPKLFKMLQNPLPRTRESALDALGSLIRDNRDLGRAIANYKRNDEYFERLSRQSSVPGAIYSATLLHLVNLPKIISYSLTNLNKVSVIENHDKTVAMTVLPALVKLLNEKIEIKTKAPLILAYLVSDNEELQKAACESDAVSKLASIITKATETTPNQLKETCLLAIAAISALREECRKQVIDCKLLPQIVKSLEDEDPSIRAAACQCAKSLSRSVKNLRTNLIDSGIAIPLLKLLNDPSLDVQLTASATICNVVLDFSPMKKIVIENNGVEILVDLLSRVTNSTMKLNVVWALKNLLYQADSTTKQKVISILTFSRLEKLLNDEDLGIQIQSVNLLRNLVCGKEQDIDLVLNNLGEAKLFKIIEHKLSSNYNDLVSQVNFPIGLHKAIFVCVNIATGNQKHKSSVMARDSILRNLLECMSHPIPEVRVATVWCTINLTWTEDIGAPEHIAKLRAMGFEEKLKLLLEDPDSEVRDRARTAVGQFNAIINHEIFEISHSLMKIDTRVKYITREFLQKNCLNNGRNKISTLVLRPKQPTDPKIKYIQNLEVLPELNEIDFKKIENIACCTKLTKLCLRNNLLRSIDNIFPLKNLTCIDLSGNLIERIPSAIKQLEKLQTLKLAHNKIELVSDFEHLKGLWNLMELDIHDNPLQGIKYWRYFILYQCRSLVYLNDQEIQQHDREISYERFGRAEKEILLENFKNAKCENFNMEKQLIDLKNHQIKLEVENKDLREALKVFQLRIKELDETLSFEKQKSAQEHSRSEKLAIQLTRPDNHSSQYNRENLQATLNKLNS